MIQGKFYQRLHFYMDSCAINPTTFLLLKGLIWCYDIKPDDSFSNVQSVNDTTQF